jgi:hypothetical protein
LLVDFARQVRAFGVGCVGVQCAMPMLTEALATPLRSPSHERGPHWDKFVRHNRPIHSERKSAVVADHSAELALTARLTRSLNRDRVCGRWSAARPHSDSAVTVDQVCSLNIYFHQLSSSNGSSASDDADMLMSLRL